MKMEDFRLAKIYIALECLFELGAIRAIKEAVMEWHSRGYLDDSLVEEFFDQYQLESV